MRVSCRTTDTAPMLRRNIVLVAPIVAVAIFVGIVVWYSSTQPSRVERIVACVEKLGYSTSTFQTTVLNH